MIHSHINLFVLGVYTSTDKGVTWNATNSAPSGVSDLFSLAADSTGMLVVILTRGFPGSIYRSTDQAKTFTLVSSAPQLYYATNCLSSSADGSKLVAVAPNSIYSPMKIVYSTGNF